MTILDELKAKANGAADGANNIQEAVSMMEFGGGGSQPPIAIVYFHKKNNGTYWSSTSYSDVEYAYFGGSLLLGSYNSRETENDPRLTAIVGTFAGYQPAGMAPAAYCFHFTDKDGTSFRIKYEYGSVTRIDD